LAAEKNLWLDHLYPALSTLIDQGGAVQNQGADQGANQGG
jgi:hypothetical protein